MGSSAALWEQPRRTCAETVGDIGPIAFSSASAATIEGDQRPPFSIDSKKGMARQLVCIGRRTRVGAVS